MIDGVKSLQDPKITKIKFSETKQYVPLGQTQIPKKNIGAKNVKIDPTLMKLCRMTTCTCLWQGS